MTMGETIREARKAKGLTQRELATILDVKFNSISNWETDKHKPDVDTLEKLCHALDISPSDVLKSEYPEETIGRIAGTVISDVEVIRFLSDYYQLEANDQKAIKQIVSSLCVNKKRDA